MKYEGLDAPGSRRIPFHIWALPTEGSPFPIHRLQSRGALCRRLCGTGYSNDGVMLRDGSPATTQRKPSLWSHAATAGLAYARAGGSPWLNVVPFVREPGCADTVPSHVTLTPASGAPFLSEPSLSPWQWPWRPVFPHQFMPSRQACMPWLRLAPSWLTAAWRSHLPPPPCRERHPGPRRQAVGHWVCREVLKYARRDAWPKL